MSIPDEVVERVARAMMDTDKHPVSSLPDDEFFAALARAALSASRWMEMREALEKIADSGHELGDIARAALKAGETP